VDTGSGRYAYQIAKPAKLCWRKVFGRPGPFWVAVGTAGAVNNFRKVTEMDSSDLAGAAAVAIGDIYAKENKIEPAIYTYDEALNKYPNLAHLVYPKIAQLYRDVGDLDKALDFYNKSLQKAPVRQMAEIAFKIAEIKEMQGRHKEAVEDYLKVTYLYPDNQDLAVKSLLRIAAIYEGEENYKEAMTIYTKISSMDVQESKYAKERIEWIKQAL